MAYFLSFNAGDEYLHVLFSGNFANGDVLALWKDLVQYLEIHPCRQVLVEEQPGTVGNLDTLEIFETAKFLAVSRFVHRTRIALLYQEEVSAETLRQALFGETVAVNRGLTFKVFHSRDAALKWVRFWSSPVSE